MTTHRGPDGRWSAPQVLGSPAYRPGWSPDGRSIVYVQTNADGVPGPVFVIPAAGGPSREVYAPGKGAPLAVLAQWGPDGQTLYYKAPDERGHTSFWSVSAAGGRPRLLIRFDDPGFQSARNDFATDGKKFYFAVADRQSDVFVADLIRR